MAFLCEKSEESGYGYVSCELTGYLTSLNELFFVLDNEMEFVYVG